VNYLWKILKTTSSLWRIYLVVSIISIAIALLNLAIPALTGMAIDEIRLGTEANTQVLVGIALLIFFTDLTITFISNIGGYWGDQMSARLYKLLGDKYYEHLLDLPQKFYDKELSGKLINRLNRSIAQISNFMQMMSNNFLQFIFSTIFSLAVVAIYSWQVALLLFMLYPIFIWMTVRSSGKWLKYQHQKNEQADIASGRFAEAINQIKVVKSFNQEKRELRFFNKHMQKAVRINIPQSKHWHRKDVERRLLLNIIFFMVYCFIFVQGANGQLSPGQTVALILYAMQIRIPIFTISFLVDNTQRAVADSKDYFEIMDINPEIKDINNAKPLTVKNGEIVFESLSFSYDKKQSVLKNINLKIEPHTKIALVGESGEGKTTLTNLLMRLYEPEKGKIQIDGKNIEEVTQVSLRRSIAVVFQDPALFSGTIKENIAYANPAATEKEIINAAKAANAHDFISKFEDGYSTEIGERGLKLSGGQKQRIAIARAILKKAPILILDEATSSLDSKSEKLVQEALGNLMKNRTTIIIAHRLSTIQNVDLIVTLRNGTIDEVGSPRELAKTSGIYAQLLQLQESPKSEKSKKKLRSYEISV
jgi:ATP-binding cassette subfamily B protein